MRMKGAGRRWCTAGVGVVLALGVSACASIGRATFQEPVVRLREVNVTGLGLTGGSLDVVLSVYNPNGYTLDALNMTYQVDIDTIRLGSGALPEHFAVTQKDSSIVRLPIRFTYAGLGAAGRSLLMAGSVNYRVRGDVTVATPLGNFTRPFDRTGRYSSVSGSGRGSGSSFQFR